LFGLGIFIADMPLSLKVAPSLGVNVRESGRNGEPVSADNLTQLLHNLDALWEPAAVAVGIAALTIAFKILIDKLQKPHRFETWWSKSLLSILLVSIFAAMIYAFVLIGQARAEHEIAGAKVNRAWLFTTLAIMFPLVCGYCFSMARSALQNVAHYSRVAKEFRIAWTQYLDANLAAELATANSRIAAEEVQAVGADNVEEEFLRNLYVHGYQRGRCVPETLDPGASLYDRCEALLHHWLAQLPQTDHESAERRV
jgi:Zn-dependent protease